MSRLVPTEKAFQKILLLLPVIPMSEMTSLLEDLVTNVVIIDVTHYTKIYSHSSLDIGIDLGSYVAMLRRQF